MLAIPSVGESGVTFWSGGKWGLVPGFWPNRSHWPNGTPPVLSPRPSIHNISLPKLGGTVWCKIFHNQHKVTGQCFSCNCNYHFSPRKIKTSHPTPRITLSAGVPRFLPPQMRTLTHLMCERARLILTHLAWQMYEGCMSPDGRSKKDKRASN